jgi:transcriptional regulator with XRE-family HTH domain
MWQVYREIDIGIDIPMNGVEMTHTLERDRARIVGRVRALREERRWTQAELARHLGLSQSRLSEIERGAGSFTAEQFVAILRLFNVGIDAFTPGAEPTAELQNALARLGATHLHENVQVIPAPRLDVVENAIRETIAHAASPRLLTALAPVLVRNVDRIHLAAIATRLAELGLERRWAWILDNTLAALRGERGSDVPRRWALRYRRAEVSLVLFLDSVSDRLAEPGRSRATRDLLDPEIRTARTVAELEVSASEISKRWGIVTAIQPADFTAALRAARVTD